MNRRDSILIAALIGLVCTGCANMARTSQDEAVATAQRSDAAQSSLAWARQWELLASAAEAPTAAEEHARLLDALEHAAAMRDGSTENYDASSVGSAVATRRKPDSLSIAGSEVSPIDRTAPTIGRANDALAELLNAGGTGTEKK